MKPTPSGCLVLQILGSNDLRVVDKDLSTKFNFEGEFPSYLNSKTYKEPHFSFEGDQMLWFGSKTDLYVVDLKSLSRFKVKDIVGDGIRAEPLFAIADFKREKYLIYFKIEQENVLIYSERGREPDPHLVDEIFPLYNELKCLDLTKNKLYGVGGGWTEDIDPSSGKSYSKGCVSAFKFTKSLDLVAEIQLPKRKCSVVTKLKWSQTHEDVLFCTTDGPLFILGFHPTINQFEVLKAINIESGQGKPNITNQLGSFADMCIFGKSLYLASGDEDSHITEVTFNSNI